ncbi:AAA family ATPase [Haloarcula sp. S1CR25-12]|uniref:AAA family ATPase n=1 Tax=Haloarcula saliterrae TaxID=2950534 RepID=A0ABU2F9L2_9EURY|nr:AAA family ATPase [Haloarcula sp. S1CR25-12]MDS0258957.1 AAA family ATPase [Haloarcula sp. S1CR25-12]
MSERALTPADAARRCQDIVDRVEEAVVVDRRVLYETLAAVIARGHVLVEDVPGTGKTVLARVLAESLGLRFTRIQFTPDLLPADVTGSNIYDEHEGAFEFAQGPVFTNVALADEINRAPPKTQAALLESMEERQVSVDGTTHDLPEPFVVIATQNPVEQEGTFRLPEAQRDRFSVKTSMGYPDVDGEMGLLEMRDNRRTLAPSVDPVVTPETVLELQELAEDIRVDEKIRRYIIDLARATRQDDRTDIGVSPRGVQRVFEAVRASAVIDGREYATPEDVKRMAQATMSHRLILTTEATVEGVDSDDIVRTAMDSVDVPAVSPAAPSVSGTGDASVNGGHEQLDPDPAVEDGDEPPRRDGEQGTSPPEPAASGSRRGNGHDDHASPDPEDTSDGQPDETAVDESEDEDDDGLGDLFTDGGEQS